MRRILLTSGKSPAWREFICRAKYEGSANLRSGWNRFAHAVVGDALVDDIVASAKFYAQLNYALANAAIGSWDSK